MSTELYSSGCWPVKIESLNKFTDVIRALGKFKKKGCVKIFISSKYQLDRHQVLCVKIFYLFDKQNKQELRIDSIVLGIIKWRFIHSILDDI